MKELLKVVTLIAVVSAAVGGCDLKEADPDAGKVPLEVKLAEAKDSTRLDSNRVDSLAADTAADSTRADATRKRPLRFR